MLVVVALVAAALAAIVSPPTARAAGGASDLSFGGGGTVLVDSTRPSVDVALAATADPSTGLVSVAGAAGERMAVARYHGSGVPTSFGNDGLVTADFGVPAVAHGLGGTVDGLIAVGQAGGDLAMAAFDLGGRAIPQFGRSGRLVVPLGGESVAEAVSGDRIVVGSVMRSNQRDLLLGKLTGFGLDTTFNATGTRTIDLAPGADDAGFAVRTAPPSNNRFYVAGHAGPAAVVARFDASTGALDTSFGVGGTVILDLTPGADVARAIAIDYDTSDVFVAGQADDRAFVARLTPSGLPVASFGGGVVQLDLGGRADVATGLVWQPGSGIVVSGTRTTLFGADGAARRITPAGLIDPTFGDTGLMVADFGSGVDRANTVAGLGAGRFFLAGHNATDMVVARFDASGVADTSFATDGKLLVDGNGVDRAGPVRLASDGRIVVVGSSGGQLVVARRLPDGGTDASFGTAGMVLDEHADADPIDAAVQPDGRILVLVGGGDRSYGTVGRLVRYLPDGRRDPSFGADGVGGFVRWPGRRSSLALLADGRILVAGSSPTKGSGVARFLASGEPDLAFGDGGFAEAGIGGQYEGGGLGVQSDGTIVLALGRPYERVLVGRITPAGTVVSVAGEYSGVGGPPVVNVLPDDRFYVTGAVGRLDLYGRPQEDALSVARFGRDGYLDSGFGTAGRVQFDVGRDEGVGDALVDGPFLAIVGRAFLGDDATTRVVRMAGSGQLDPRYGTNGVSTIAPAFTPIGAARSPDGRLVVAGSYQAGTTTDIILTRLQAGPATEPPPPTTTTIATQTTTSAPTRTTAPPPPAPAPPPRRSGYWMVSRAGATYAFGDARHLGNALTVEAVDLEPTPSGHGYWIVDAAGRLYPFGDARSLGAMTGSGLATGETVTSLSATPTGAGYWLFTTRGRVIPFGDAAFRGDMSSVRLNGPVLDSIATSSGAGYYLVASDGGIFAFGDARFQGSMGGKPLNAPVESLVPDSDGSGYWLVAADGGVFAFDAPFRGSMGGQRLNRPVTGMVRYGSGYLMVGEDGGIFNFSDKTFAGSLGASPPPDPIVAVAALNLP